ncbi:MAG TPA: methyltransferase domain-containing protein [Pyrinomonadaceae bacterium]|nr:methyltransferase domain-containing protein [Pyrinomonadaceae bacterium]
MELDNYHLDELRIAKTAGHPQRILPPITKAHRKVLDIGCGAGQSLMATNFEPGTTVIGVDVDKSALTLGRQLDKNISFVCARAECLPFQPERLDFVFSRVALPYMNVRETLFEIRRVLKRGGTLWLVLHPYSIVLKELVQSISQLKIKRAAVCLYVIANGMVLNLLGREFHLPFRKDYYESFQTIKGISRLLRKAGFEEIKAERNGFFVATARKVQ